MDWDSDEAEAMLANTTVDIKNGVLSFENPNYSLNTTGDTRISDALKSLNGNINNNNSTTSATSVEIDNNSLSLDGGLAALDSLYSELDHACALSRSSAASSGSGRNRRHYARLNPGSMGVDVIVGPVVNNNNNYPPHSHIKDHQNNSLVPEESTGTGTGTTMGRKKGETFDQPDLIEHLAKHNNLQQELHTLQILDNQDRKAAKIINERDTVLTMVRPNNPDGIDNLTLKDNEVSAGMRGGTESPRLQNNRAFNREVDNMSPITDIPHMTPDNSQDLYALPLKRSPGDGDEDEKKTIDEDILPPGWEKHEDNDGPYFWHIKSGTITREPPAPYKMKRNDDPPVMREKKHKEQDQITGSVTRSNTSSGLCDLAEVRPRTTAQENAYKRRSYPVRSELDSGHGRPIRFAVRSLGWVEISEDDLTPERSSKAVNRCIVDLSGPVGRRDIMDVVGRWGEGKDLFMDLDEGSLKLLDPENLTLLNTQPIHTIRVWGVGRDNGRERDFAYVARDKYTRKHMCHVFRCDTPARTIANTLRDICKKIMIERSLHQTIPGRQIDNVSSSANGGGRLARPTNLPTEHRRIQRHPQLMPSQSFPTPMEEPKKVLPATYLGCTQVLKASGMEVLNNAIQSLMDERDPKNIIKVQVAVAPSTITITNMNDCRQIAECRVRYLSFLGIGENVKTCAFIMHTAQDQYIAHAFECDPSSGALCKTIEAACKLRYQKCLDAHPGGGLGGRSSDGKILATTPKSISAALRSVFTTFSGRKSRSTES